MGLTAFFKFRYPDPTDPVQTGSTNFQNLAKDVEATFPRIITGYASLVFNAQNEIGAPAIFPAGLFVVPPNVLCSSEDDRIVCAASAITTTAASIFGKTGNLAVVTLTVKVYWIAIENQRTRT